MPSLGSSIDFGVANLLLRIKVQILASAVREFQLLQCGDGSLWALVPDLLSAGSLNHHNLQLCNFFPPEFSKTLIVSKRIVHEEKVLKK